MGAISEALTIRELKETLQREYPGRPPVSAQRLILSGKLLSDSESLGGLVADSDGVAEVSCRRLKWAHLSNVRFDAITEISGATSRCQGLSGSRDTR